MKLSIIGGGPAGLYLAYLVKTKRPSTTVTVYERGPADATWGFGVVLADGGLRQLEAVDEVSYREISAALHPIHAQAFTVDGVTMPIDKARPGGAIGRLTLLLILQRLCRACGVELRHGTQIESLSCVDGDLIVGADGAGSIVRTSLERELGTKQYLLNNRFAWYGASREFDVSHLNFKRILSGRGAVVGHYYSYAPGKSTFVMECDGATWEALGLEALSDDDKRKATQRFFADELNGSELIANNSIWRRFPVITSERWHHAGRYVLIGDALRTAHYSIGSGTRMALEDAIALATALDANPDSIAAALESFVRLRQPQMEKLRTAAERSFNWYENFRTKIETMTAPDVAYDFMMRTGRIDGARLARDFPSFVRSYEALGKLGRSGPRAEGNSA